MGANRASDLPVAPGPALVLLSLDPGADAELALGDLDLAVFALLVGAAGTGTRSRL